MQQRLRTEQRPDRELDAPAAETSIEKAVDRVMARIRLVAGQIQGAIDGERQGRIDLNAARRMTLIARVCAPRQVGHILDVDALARRQRDVLACGRSTALNRARQHRRQPVPRDQKSPVERRVAR